MKGINRVVMEVELDNNSHFYGIENVEEIENSHPLSVIAEHVEIIP